MSSRMHRLIFGTSCAGDWAEMQLSTAESTPTHTPRPTAIVTPFSNPIYQVRGERARDNIVNAACTLSYCLIMFADFATRPDAYDLEVATQPTYIVLHEKTLAPLETFIILSTPSGHMTLQKLNQHGLCAASHRAPRPYSRTP